MNSKSLLGGALLTGISFAAFGVAAAPALAQSTDEIIITAQRREQTLTEVPLSVQAFSGAALENAQVENVSDLVRVAPSVAFSAGYSPSTSGFLIRGVSSRIITGVTQPSSAVVIDGVPLVRQGEFVSELADIERVEVLRGPQGTLFGKNATAGVLNIVTQSPVDEVEASTQIGYTTDDEASVRAMLNAGGGNTWVRVNAFWRDLQPIIENINPGDDDIGASESWGLSAKLRTDITPELSWLLSANYYEGQNTFGQLQPTVPSTGVAGAFQVGYLGYTPTRDTTFVNINSTPWNTWSGSGLVSELAWDISDSWTLTSITGFRQFDEDNDFDIDANSVGVNIGTPISGVNPANGSFLPATNEGYPLGYIWHSSEYEGQFDNPVATDYWSQEIRANYSGERLDIVTGVFYQSVEQQSGSGTPIALSNNVQLQIYSDSGGEDGTPCSTLTLPTIYCFAAANSNQGFGNYTVEDDTWAVFGDVTFKLTDTVSAFGGLRYTHEELAIDYVGNVYGQPGVVPGQTSAPLPLSVFDEVTGTLLAPPAASVAYSAVRTENDLSGRLGMQWEPSANQNFYISYSRAYKGPGIDVDNAPLLGGNAVWASDLFVDPETGIAWEIGAKQRLFDGRLMLNISVFDQTIENIQVSTTVPGTIQTNLINAGDLDLKGIELEFRWAATDNFTIDGGLAFIDAEHVGGVNACNTSDLNSVAASAPGSTGVTGLCTLDLFNNAVDGLVTPDGIPTGTPGADGFNDSQSLTGLKPQNTPELRASINFNYDRQLTFIPFSLAARLGYNWQDEMPGAVDGDPLTVIPAYGVFDGSITLAADTGNWEVTVFGKNLTDELVISTMSANDGAISRVSNIYGRDYRRYGGIMFRASF